jgi:hypothetical protein
MFLLVPFLFLFQENKVKMVMGLCFQRRRHDDGAFSPSPFFSSLSDVRLPPIAPRRLPQPPSKPPLAAPTAFFGRYCMPLPLSLSQTGGIRIS